MRRISCPSNLGPTSRSSARPIRRRAVMLACLPPRQPSARCERKWRCLAHDPGFRRCFLRELSRARLGRQLRRHCDTRRPGAVRIHNSIRSAWVHMSLKCHGSNQRRPMLIATIGTTPSRWRSDRFRRPGPFGRHGWAPTRSNGQSRVGRGSRLTSTGRTPTPPPPTSGLTATSVGTSRFFCKICTRHSRTTNPGCPA